MLISRAGWLILSLGLFPGQAALASGNHCEAIRKNKNKCDGVQGEKLEDVHEKCEALLKKQKEAREQALSSCGDEAISVAGKRSCLATAFSQRDIDSCNAAADEGMRTNAGSAAGKQSRLAEEIRQARKDLEEAIEKAKADPEVDKSKLAKAEKVSTESRTKIENDVTGLAQADQQAADSLGSVGSQGNANASDLPTAQPNDASMGNLASSGGTSAPSVADSNPSAASGNQLAFAPVSDGGGGSDGGSQTLANPSFSGGSPDTGLATMGGGAAVAAAAPTVSDPNVTASGGAVAAAASPVGMGSNGVGSTSSGSRSASAAPLILGSSSAGSAADGAESSAASSARGGLRDDLRRRIMAAALKSGSASGAAASADAEVAEQHADGSSPASYSGGRAPASLSSSADGAVEAVAASSDTLEPFSNSLGGPRFALMSSETEASVKKIVKELSGADSATQSSSEEIGERNGPTLFARSHATIERSLRKGRVRGVAMR